MIDFSAQTPRKRQPARKELARYWRWRRYLARSKLTPAEQHERSCQAAEAGRDPEI